MLAVALLDDFDCADCSAARQIERGCDTDSPLGVFMTFDGAEMRRCPRRPVKEDPHFYAMAFERYDAYMKGHLPDEGALESQAYKVMRVNAVVSSAIDEARAEKHRKAEEEAARRARQASSKR